MKIAWVVMVIWFQAADAPHHTILMQDGHIYATKAACMRSRTIADLITWHQNVDAVTGGRSEIACVSEKIVR